MQNKIKKGLKHLTGHLLFHNQNGFLKSPALDRIGEKEPGKSNLIEIPSASSSATANA